MTEKQDKKTRWENKEIKWKKTRGQKTTRYEMMRDKETTEDKRKITRRENETWKH